MFADCPRTSTSTVPSLLAPRLRRRVPNTQPMASAVAASVRRATRAGARRCVDAGHDAPPSGGQVETNWSLCWLVGARECVDPAEAEGPLSGLGHGHEIPDLVLDHEAERMDRARGVCTIAVGVAKADHHAVDHGHLDRFEKGGGADLGVVPTDRVADHGLGRGRRSRAKGGGEGGHELAQRRFDLGGGGRRSSEEEQGGGLVGVQPAQVGLGPAVEGPPAPSARQGIDGNPRLGESFEVAPGRAF